MRRHDDRGTGLVPTVTGVLVFLLLLTVALQVLVGLYATSVVSSSAWDAARTAAAYRSTGADGDSVVRRQVTEELQSRLKGFREVSVEWSDDVESVQLTVRARRPSFVPGDFNVPGSLDWIERTVTVRRETLQ